MEVEGDKCKYPQKKVANADKAGYVEYVRVCWARSHAKVILTMKPMGHEMLED